MAVFSRAVSRRAVLQAGAQGAILAMPVVHAGAQGALSEISITNSSSGLPYGGLRMAQQAGLFEKNGLKIRLIVSESGNAATTALLAGSVEMSGAGPSEAIVARARGQNIVIVGNLYRGLSGSLVLAKPVVEKLGIGPDAPVEQRLKALEGLTIASPSATSAYTGPVKNSAADLNVKPKLVYMAQPAMPAALETGAIQGMIGAAPFSTVPVVKGTGVLWISGPKAQFPAKHMPTSSACLHTTEAYATANPDVIRKIQALLADISAFIKQKPAEAKANLGKAYPSFDAPTLDNVFEQDADNWTRPIFTIADMEQERRILEETQSVPGLDKLDFVKLLRMPA